MRHGKKFNHLGRTASHRSAMLSNMASSLIINKRITTTTAKAKALRKYVEPLITKSKTDTTQSRRVVFSYLQDKVSSQILFDEVAEKVADRPGGYTRIIKLGNRLGDAAEMAMIELVDFNEIYNVKEETKTRTRRSRRGGGGKKKSGDDSATTQAQATDTTNTAVADAPSETSTETQEATDIDTSSEQAATVETPTSEASAEEHPHVVHVVETEDHVVHLSGEAALDEEIIVDEVDETEAISDKAVADDSTADQASKDRPTTADTDEASDANKSEEDEDKPKQ